MAPCLYPFGKPARATADPEVAPPRDAPRGGRVSAETNTGKRDAGPSSASTPSPSASPPSPFAHLADVWDVDTLRVARETKDGPSFASAEKTATDDVSRTTGAESGVVAAAEALRARLLASGASLRGDPFSPKAQVRAARADKQRARRVFVHDPLSLDGDVGSSSDEEDEEDAAAAAAAAARRTERRDARLRAKAFASVNARDRADAHQHALGLALKTLADDFEADVSLTDLESKTRRMEDVVGLAMLWCGSVFRVDDAHAEKKKKRPNAKPPPTPPLGTHLIRRTALDSNPRVLDLYVQDQCSYLYDHAVRTADHFVDGARQKVHASAKFAFAPRAEPRGAAVAVALDPPAPFKWAKKEKETVSKETETETHHQETAFEREKERSDCDSDSDGFVVVSPPSLTETAENSDAQKNEGPSRTKDPQDPPDPPRDELPPWTRQGSFVELGGCSGHPDYLRRVGTPERECETYEIESFPALRFERFVKGAPVARFVGEMRVVCKRTNLLAVVRFRPYDAAFAQRTGVRGNVVSGAVYALTEESERDSRRKKEVLRVVLGRTDGDVESLPVTFSPREMENENAHFNAESQIRRLIRGMAPYSNATRGGFDARDALWSPGVMAQRRLWHAVVDAMHARDLREPLNSVKYELLHPLRRCAAELILGRDERYIGAEPKKEVSKPPKEEPNEAKEDKAKKQTDKDPFAPFKRGDDVGRRMRYEGTFLLAGTLPDGSPGPLPRFWNPQPSRRMRR